MAKQKKDSQLLIKINREEKYAFIEMCEEQDTTASREIRAFIKGKLAEANPAVA